MSDFHFQMSHPGNSKSVIVMFTTSEECLRSGFICALWSLELSLPYISAPTPHIAFYFFTPAYLGPFLSFFFCLTHCGWRPVPLVLVRMSPPVVREMELKVNSLSCSFSFLLLNSPYIFQSVSVFQVLCCLGWFSFHMHGWMEHVKGLFYLKLYSAESFS